MSPFIFYHAKNDMQHRTFISRVEPIHRHDRLTRVIVYVKRPRCSQSSVGEACFILGFGQIPTCYIDSDQDCVNNDARQGKRSDVFGQVFCKVDDRPERDNHDIVNVDVSELS